MLFLNEKFENGSRREEVKAALEAESDGEKVTITAVTKKIAEMWREIKETDAGLPYIEKAAALKEALAEQVDSEASSDNESEVSAPAPSPVGSPEACCDDSRVRKTFWRSWVFAPHTGGSRRSDLKGREGGSAVGA